MTEKSSFLKLLISHEVDLRAFIAAMVRDRQQREDIYQEVAIAIWESFEKYDPARPFGAWARGIARYKILKLWDSDRRSALTFTPDAIHSIANAYDDAQPDESAQSEALRACMDKLPDNARRVLDLRYRNELKLEAIASQIGQTASGVHRALARIRAGLAECITKRVRDMERGDA